MQMNCFLPRNREHLQTLLPKIDYFLQEAFGLELHPNKVSITSISSGIDFLGWVNFSNYRVPHNSTVRRMKRRLDSKSTPEAIQSYHGLLSHGNATQLQDMLLDEYGQVGNDRRTV